MGRSQLLTAHAEGTLSLEEIREFLLGMPGLPSDTVRQLRAIDDWRNTLPVPVPGEVRWQDTTVRGEPAVALQGTDGLGSAVLWQQEGFVHGVGGFVAEVDARRIAEDLDR